jgi:hypothetical protein
VRSAEAVTRGAAPTEPDPVGDDDLAGALFLAEAAVAQARLAPPVQVEQAEALLTALLDQGLEPDELLAVLPSLPVQADAADEVALLLEVRRARER